MLRDYVKKKEASGMAVPKFDFYVDCVKKSDHKQILADIDKEIQAMKSKIEEMTQIEVENIKQFEDFMSSPEQYLK